MSTIRIIEPIQFIVYDQESRSVLFETAWTIEHLKKVLLSGGKDTQWRSLKTLQAQPRHKRSQQYNLNTHRGSVYSLALYSVLCITSNTLGFSNLPETISMSSASNILNLSSNSNQVRLLNIKSQTALDHGRIFMTFTSF